MLWLAGAATIAGFAGLVGWRRWAPSPRIRSLAVLPFANAARDDDAEYLCDGITEGLIHRLLQLPSLTVMARSLVSNFKRSRGDPRAIGRQLGVGAVLTGIVAGRQRRLLITAELLDVATGARLWSASYDRGAADTLFVEEDIANAIVEHALLPSWKPRERNRCARRPTQDVEAYERCLRAVHHFEDGGEADDIAAKLNEALAKDRTFALAYAALATTLVLHRGRQLAVRMAHQVSRRAVSDLQPAFTPGR